MKYDIFISYKRKSLPTANNLYYRLTTRGYSTFFDLEEMGRDNFNTQLLNYIENANDVFVILEEGSLDCCQNGNWENDWFCREIVFALEKRKNIIPILLGDFKMPPENFFPEKMKDLCLKNAPEFTFSFFEAYLDKLIEKNYLLSKPNKQDTTSSVFKFYSNKNSLIYKEGKLVCSLEGMSEEPYYLPVSRKGDYRFKVVNTLTAETKTIKEHIDADEEKDIEIIWEEQINNDTGIVATPPLTKDPIIKTITMPDYSDLKIGDYFYNDGTTSHQKLPDKKCVGIVFSLNTTPTEKEHGWTHGQIISTEFAVLSFMGDEAYGFLGLKTRKKLYEFDENRWVGIFDFKWGKALPVPHKQYKQWNSVECINDKDGYIYTHSKYVQTLDNYHFPNFPCFYLALEYNKHQPLPKDSTSGWYLPTISQLIDVIQNLCGSPIEKMRIEYIWERLKQYGILTGSNFHCNTIASSTESNDLHIWTLRDFKPFYTYKNPAQTHCTLMRTLPAAAF